MDKINAEKHLRKSKLYMLYESCKNPEIQQEILINYKKLLTETTITDRNIVYQNRYYIYPSIAIYQTFQKYDYEKSEILQQIEAEILATGEGMKHTFAKVGKLKFFFLLFKKMCFISTKTSYKKPYFDMRWTDHGKDKIAWECHKCHYHDEFTKHHFPELTKIFCRLDDVMYGSIPTATWARTKTIGDGDALCDFCFIKNNN
ncbi:MAG: L-2-amino-thiazoline-4-carboxylic acid hydrolase [Bacillota bacterium]